MHPPFFRHSSDAPVPTRHHFRRCLAQLSTSADRTVSADDLPPLLQDFILSWEEIEIPLTETFQHIQPLENV
jgi:hypothetical protein